MLMHPILVTGSTGNVGREVVRALVARGAAVRVGDRDPSRARSAAGGVVEAVALDLRDRATYAPAVAGCRGVFLMRPPAIADTRATLVPFIDAVRAAGAGPVVFLSVAGAEKNKIVPHRAVEDHLRAGEPAHTILRPGFFAQNLGDAYRRDIVEDGRLYVPAGRGVATFVDVRDVAEVATLALTEPAAHRAAAYTLTGPAAVSFAEAAELLARVLGRPIRYVPASMVGYALHLRRRRGLPWGQAAVQTILHVGLRLGQAATVDPTLARLLGRSTRTLRTYIEDHAALWRRG